MTGKYVKDKVTGLVVDVSADYDQYIREKHRVKALTNTKKDLDQTKNEISSLRGEIGEIKELLQQLLKAKS